MHHYCYTSFNPCTSGILYYIFIFAFHFRSCVIFVYVSILHNCCAIIHCYNDMFHIISHAGYVMNLWNVCNVNVNLYVFTNQLPVGVHGSVELLALSVIGVELALKLRWIGWKTILKHKRTMIKVSLLPFFINRKRDECTAYIVQSKKLHHFWVWVPHAAVLLVKMIKVQNLTQSPRW